MPEQTITPDFDAALKEFGYFDDSTTVIKLSLKMSGLTEQPAFSYQPTPTPGLTWGKDEVCINGSRVQKSSLYVPGLTRFEDLLPFHYAPHLYVYTTPALKTQAIADMKQGMRAILTRKKMEAERLIAAFDEAIDSL